MYIGLGFIPTKSFNFQFAEVPIVITTICFYSPSQYECVSFHFTSANTKLALPVILMSNMMLHLMLLQGNFLRVKPLRTVAEMRRRAPSHGAWGQRFICRGQF